MKSKLLTAILLFTMGMGIAQPFEWPIKELDTARDVSYLSEKEKDIILEMNMVRSNPKKYAEQNIFWMNVFYNGKMLEIPGKIALKTEEGKEAFDECMVVLKKAEPASILKPAKGMTRACELLVYDQELTGNTGHKDSGGNQPVDRLLKFGEFSGYFAENIHYGDIEPRFTVISLLIDDGVRSRGHRKNILNPEFHYAGVATGQHKTFGGMCVINYATKYTNK
jgi:uncharacterized protein YkwD